MKKELLKFLCTSLFALGCMSVNATVYNGNCGDSEGDEPTSAVTWSFDTSTGTLTLTGTGAIKTYNAPDYPWNNAAFNPTDDDNESPTYGYWTGIQSIIVGEGITNIPDWAFAMQCNCMSISLPSTLKSIGWSALEECQFWNIYLPEGLETIGDYAFYASVFETISIPSTVISIGDEAFAGCTNLTSVGCYASTPPTLGSSSFVFGTVETVYVQSAKVTEYKAADGWSDFGDKIQSPAGYCGPNGSDDDGDDDVTKATWSFDMATRTLTIEGTKMGQYNRPWESAGMGGTGGGFNPDNNVGYPCGIKRVVIGEGITAIPGSAFYMEVGIKSVNLPSTLESISMNAFGECFNIETITCNAATPPTLGEEGSENFVFFGTFDEETGDPNPIETLTAIYVPAGTEGAYKNEAGWSDYADLIQMPNTVIGGEHWTTFYDATTNYEVDENTSIMIVWGIEDGKIKTGYTNLSPESDNIIPAGQAVILRSTGIPVLTATPTESTNDAFNDNLLLGSEADKGDFENYNYYALANAGAGLGFYKVGNGTTIPVGKAYLKIDKAASSNFYSIDPDDNTTAIKNMKIGKDNNVYYDLSGRRVLYPKKGLYIMNGKKVIIK